MAHRDPALMRETFAVDCFEYAQTGRIFLLEDLIFEDGGPEFVAILPLESFCLRHLASDVVDATYVSEVTINETTERTNRSSIWSNHRGHGGYGFIKEQRFRADRRFGDL